MIRRIPARASQLLPIVRAASLIAAAVILGACASIPQRAWRNGEAMSGSLAYRSIMNGDKSFNTHRALEGTLDPLRMNYHESAFPPFGHWWY
jgi:hypothetical protein